MRLASVGAMKPLLLGTDYAQPLWIRVSFKDLRKSDFLDFVLLRDSLTFFFTFLYGQKLGFSTCREATYTGHLTLSWTAAHGVAMQLADLRPWGCTLLVSV
jgi:hypothetical protein